MASDPLKGRAARSSRAARWGWRLGVLAFGMTFVGGMVLLFGPSQDRTGLNQARLDLANGRIREAKRWLVRQSGSDRSGGEVPYLLGLCEHAGGDPKAALRAWERVPEGSPYEDQASLARAQTLVGDFGRFAKAEPLLKRAIRGEGPTAVEARHALFELFFLEGRDQEMRQLVEEAWDRLPEPASELRDHWRTTERPPDLETLHDLIDPAARKAPDDDRTWLAEAHLALLEDRDDDAGKLLDACLRRRPDDPVVWRAVLRWARTVDQVAAGRQAIRKLGPDHLSRQDALDVQAWLAHHEGDVKAERAALKAWAALDPSATRAVRRLMVLELKEGHPERVGALSQQTAALVRVRAQYQGILEGDQPFASFEDLAKLAERLGRHFESFGWWSLAVRQAPDRPVLREALEESRRRLEAERRSGA